MKSVNWLLMGLILSALGARSAGAQSLEDALKLAQKAKFDRCTAWTGDGKKAAEASVAGKTIVEHARYRCGPAVILQHAGKSYADKTDFIVRDDAGKEAARELLKSDCLNDADSGGKKNVLGPVRIMTIDEWAEANAEHAKAGAAAKDAKSAGKDAKKDEVLNELGDKKVLVHRFIKIED